MANTTGWDRGAESDLELISFEGAVTEMAVDMVLIEGGAFPYYYNRSGPLY